MKQLHIQSISRRLSYLFISFILCSCWPCCKHDTGKPIKKLYKGQVLERSSVEKEIPTNIVESLPVLFAGRTNFGLNPNLTPMSRPQDITLDIEEGADIQGDAWDPSTISKIKAHAKYQGQFGTIIFERIGTLPLYWGKYLEALCAQSSNDFYKLPDNQASLVQSSYYDCMAMGRAQLLQTYKKGLGFYHELEKVQLSTLELLPTTYQASLEVDPQLVTLTNSQEALFPNEEALIPQLNQVITATAPTENTILKDYYDLLAPGGLLIFMSAASTINRFGGIIVQHQMKTYTPFQDLDDPNMQAVYRSIFERAGFVNIQFYKDPCFMEDVIVLVAKKP